MGKSAPTVHGIFIANSDGTGARRLTTGLQTAKAYNTEAQWSPDGATIAFTRIKNNKEAAIFTIRTSGTELTKLTPYKLDGASPDWSADGDRIAFSSYYDSPGGKAARVYVMRSDGSQRKLIIRDRGDTVFSFQPSWSPDGTRIVFVRAAPKNKKGDYLLRLLHDESGWDQERAADPDGGCVSVPSRLGGGAVRARLAPLAVVAAIAASAASGAPAAVKDKVSCGDRITTDTKLQSDVVDCPSDGLLIRGDDLTLDLNGHTIEGNGKLVADCPEGEPCDIGIDAFRARGVTIKNGSLRRFGYGVEMAEARDVRVRNVSSSHNHFDGILAVDTRRVEVVRRSASRNGLATDSPARGHRLPRNVDRRNRLNRNADLGLFTINVNRSLIERDVMARNPEAGIILEATATRSPATGLSTTATGSPSTTTATRSPATGFSTAAAVRTAAARDRLEPRGTP